MNRKKGKERPACSQTKFPRNYFVRLGTGPLAGQAVLYEPSSFLKIDFSRQPYGYSACSPSPLDEVSFMSWPYAEFSERIVNQIMKTSEPSSVGTSQSFVPVFQLQICSLKAGLALPRKIYETLRFERL